MIDLDLGGVARRARGLRTGLVRGLLMGSVLTACLAASVGQALAAPDLDPNGTYVYDAATNVTVITTPAYAIGPWVTVRQTYSCNGGLVQGGPNGWGFQNLIGGSVSASYNGWNAVGDSFSDFSLLLTNWSFSAGQYQIRYRCSGYVLPVGTLPPQALVAGMRVHAPGDPAIYLIDTSGQKLHIADPQTYQQLFRDWNGILVADVSNVPSGPDLTSSSYLAWDGTPGDRVYLLTNGQKRWITNPAVFNRYDFAVTQITVQPRSVLDRLPDGPLLT